MPLTPLQPATGPVAVLGLGAMGLGMAHNLLRLGWRLRVWARRPAVLAPLLQAGAQTAATVADTVHGCQALLLSLPDAATVQQLLWDDAAAAALPPGALVIDTSTVGAQAARAHARQLAAHGLHLVDAPVSGGQAGAAAGTLACMAGGEPAVLQAALPLLQAFCKTITPVGEAGAGQTVKACNQVAVAAALMGVAEAMALARAQGVDPEAMRQVLLGGSARSFSLEQHGPRMVAERFDPGFRAVLMRKDLRLALADAQAAGLALPAAALMQAQLDRSCQQGDGDCDWSVVSRQWQAAPV